MARASTPTLLSLDRFAAIFGINPVHFNGGDGNSINIFPIIQNCNDFWPQYAWQYSDRLSREELARAIYSAEEDIARVVGYYPAPKWVAQEVHRFEQHYRRDMWGVGGFNVRGARKSITLNYGKFIQAGQRAVTLVGTATVAGGTLVYSDEDGDGYDETATITLATTLTDECEINAYFAGRSGAKEWEIRPAVSKTISGGNIVLVFRSWMLFDPDLWELYPPYTEGSTTLFHSIDISDNGNYVTSVEVYREYTDLTATSATFYWEPEPSTLGLAGCTTCGGTGCAACSLQTQDGCIHARDVESSVVVPVPADYDADEGAWDQVAYSVCRDPDMVKVYYKAGELGERWMTGDNCDRLGDFWARIIARMAMSRLTKAPCSCAHVRAQYDELRADLAKVGRESSYIFDPAMLSNPFGTRVGELEAWRKVDGVTGRRLGGGAI